MEGRERGRDEHVMLGPFIRGRLIFGRECEESMIANKIMKEKLACLVALVLVILVGKSASAEIICVGDARQCAALRSGNSIEPYTHTTHSNGESHSHTHTQAAPWVIPPSAPYRYEPIDAEVGDVLWFVYMSNHNVELMASESR